MTTVHHRARDLPVACHAAELIGRGAERRVLDRLVEAVRGGSQALVVHGEPGMGKTALLEYLRGSAPGCRIERAAGVQSEMELAFAGLHQLCAPMLDRLEAVPVPQREALRTAFGMSAGPAADRFLVGLAVLSLMSAVAERRPLICLVDDGQWLDHASRTVLAFVARRLGAESVGLVLATRGAGGDLAGLPELEVGAWGRPTRGRCWRRRWRASSCARLTACWRGSARRRRSRSGHAASCWPPASECASAPWRPAAS
jgi:hypothetical protein